MRDSLLKTTHASIVTTISRPMHLTPTPLLSPTIPVITSAHQVPIEPSEYHARIDFRFAAARANGGLAADTPPRSFIT